MTMTVTEMEGQMMMTSDPVSVVEIADRCGVELHVAQHWRRKGKLGEPHWKVGPTVAWAWEVVSDTEVVRQHLGTYDWSEVLDAVPRLAPLWAVEAGPDETYNVQRRIDRNMSARDEPCGWVSVPIANGRRLFVTDYGGFGAGYRIESGSWKAVLRDKIDLLPALYRSGDRRVPAVSPVWG